MARRREIPLDADISDVQQEDGNELPGLDDDARASAWAEIAALPMSSPESKRFADIASKAVVSE